MLLLPAERMPQKGNFHHGWSRVPRNGDIQTAGGLLRFVRFVTGARARWYSREPRHRTCLFIFPEDHCHEKPRQHEPHLPSCLERRLSLWVAVAENAKGRSKGGSARAAACCSTPAHGRSGGRRRVGRSGFRLNTACRAALVLLTSLTVITHAARAADAANASVTAGAGHVSTLGNVTTINQSQPAPGHRLDQPCPPRPTRR